MTKIVYVSADGDRTEVDANDGDSVMQTAIANDVDGIVGECGGAMMCATCHVYVDESFIEKTGFKSEGEQEMLENAASPEKPTSRLSCQIKISPDLDGLIVQMPESQL